MQNLEDNSLSIKQGIISDRKWLWMIFGIFGLFYCSLSFANHYFFRTTMLDLGVYNHCLYEYAHFHIASAYIDGMPFRNLLSDHFELYPVILSPLYFIFGSYTLLIAQIASVLFGGWGVYKYLKFKTDNSFLSRAGMVHFFLAWGIYTALAFDYHNNVVAAMLVPWLFYYFEKDNKIKTIIFLILILIGKENMALWAGFICMGIAWVNYKDKKKLIFASSMALASFLFFIVILKWVMPAMADKGRGYLHFQFSAIGHNFQEAASFVIFHPIKAFSLLVESQVADISYLGFKPVSNFFILLSGGWVFFYRPQYFLMLIPIYGQKFFNDDMSKWGLYYHYSIEFAPILSIALFSWIAGKLNGKAVHIFSIAAVFISFLLSLECLESTQGTGFNRPTHRFYSTAHYKQDFNVDEVDSALKLIPPNASVSAQSTIAPHLANRDSIYEFPNGLLANYLVIKQSEGGYHPISEEMLDSMRNHYSHIEGTKILYDKNAMLIVKQ